MRHQMETMTGMQQQLNAVKKRERDVDFIWEERMREKEVGMNNLLQEMAGIKEDVVIAEEKVRI